MNAIFLIVLFIILFLVFAFVIFIFNIGGYGLFSTKPASDLFLMAGLPAAIITYWFAKIWLSDKENKDK